MTLFHVARLKRLLLLLCHRRDVRHVRYHKTDNDVHLIEIRFLPRLDFLNSSISSPKSSKQIPSLLCPTRMLS